MKPFKHTKGQWTQAGFNVLSPSPSSWYSVHNGCNDSEPLNAGELRANAARIVLCCNAHDALVDALKQIVDCNESDLAKYCAKVDAIACETLAKLEAGKL